MNTPRLTPLTLAALLVLSVVIAYIPAISAGFIWDDDALVTKNPLVVDAAHHGLSEIWLGKNSRDYTPLTITAFRIEYSIWHDAAVWYHIVNILLHAACAVLLWLILVDLGIPAAWFAALLFAIHPVSVASVAWIAELKNTLSAVLFLGSLHAYLRMLADRNCNWYRASILLFLLAGFAKGAVVVIPVILLICIQWRYGKITRRDLIGLIPFAVIAAGIAWLTIRYQGRAENYHLIPEDFAHRIARAGHAFWWYLARVIFPAGLGPMAPQWVPDYSRGAATASAYIPVLAVAALLFYYVARWKTLGRPLFYIFTVYLVMLLPVFGVFAWLTLQQETIATDWWQYLAAPAIYILIAAALVKLTQKRPPALQYAFGAVIALPLLIQAWRTAATYESMETYCAAAVAGDPAAYTLQNNLGIIHKQKGEIAEAVTDFTSAILANPRYAEAYYNYGNLYFSARMFELAEIQYQEALRLRPGSADITSALAETYFHENKIREAIATQAAAIKLDRTNPHLYVSFGIMLAANNQHAQAIVCYKNALALEPANFETRILLIRSLLVVNQHEAAAVMTRESLALALKLNDTAAIATLKTLQESAPANQ